MAVGQILSEALALLRGPYLLPVLGLSLVVYLVISYAAAWYRLRAFSGPPLACLSYLWMTRIWFTGRQAEHYEHINQRYGSVARIGPNDLITDDPALIRRMNGARSTYRRSCWYAPLRMDPYDEGLFTMTDTAAHDRLRARMAYGYAGKENPTLEHDIDGQLASLVDYIRRRYLSDAVYGTTRQFDAATAAQYFTLDVITKIAYGNEFGYLETDSDVYEITRTVEGRLPLLALFSDIPFLGYLSMQQWVLKLFGPKTTDTKGVGRMMGVAETVVAERFGPDAKDLQDMLGAFVRHGVTQRQCEIEVPFQLIAGSDTTATAIRATLLHLVTTRHAYTRLQAEIDAAVTERRISNPITNEEAKKLEYLQAVIYEGLRMQIPFSGLVMKQVPPGGDTIDGRFVPGGTRIAHNTLGVQRRRDIFGDDADVFRPERWLQAPPERRQLMTQTTELVFGYGRWGCLGKPVAFMELNKVYVELLRRFDFELLHPKRPWREMNSNIFFQSELWMRVTERFPDRAE